MASDEGDEQPIVVTAYEIVPDEHVPTVLNTRLESNVTAYEEIAAAQTTYILANNRVITLLTAADSCSAGRGECLSAAERLNEWLISAQEPGPHDLVNRWQVLARRSELTNEIRNEIRDLKRQAATSDYFRSGQTELACALLLGETGSVDYLASRLSEDHLIKIQIWSIWALHTTEAPAPPSTGTTASSSPQATEANT